MPLITRLLLGLIFSCAIAYTAYRKDSLSKSGALGAVVVGTIIFGFGGWIWGMLLIGFFVLSTLLSRFQSARKEALAGEKFEKGGRRDIWQVMANAGVASVITILHHFIPGPALFYAFVGAMAAVNADTWATEIGTLSKRPPRLITTGAIIEAGSSGGVTLMGTVAAAFGGAVIGMLAILFLQIDALFTGPALTPTFAAGILLSAAVGGLGGAFLDSLLGATVQAIYWSESRGVETEKRLESDGTTNALHRGYIFLNNDWVNGLSALFAALLGALVSQVI